jgi:hypothetical protein
MAKPILSLFRACMKQHLGFAPQIQAWPNADVTASIAPSLQNVGPSLKSVPSPPEHDFFASESDYLASYSRQPGHSHILRIYLLSPDYNPRRIYECICLLACSQ